VIARTERSRQGLGEVVAGLGGAVLLVALLAPVGWFEELSNGGITGQGTGEPPRSLTAWDEFGLWLIPIALAAATPLVQLVLNRTGRSIPSTIRLLVAAGVLAVLTVGVVSELTYSLPPCCDQAYWVPSAEAGLIPAAVGAGLLALGTLASWLRQRPGSLTRTGQAGRIGECSATG
jgi:hypothetical protein